MVSDEQLAVLNARIPVEWTHYSVPDWRAPFQDRVRPWMLACFGEEISRDTAERNHRFLEEALELVQALGCERSEAHQLVEYVYGRDIGEPHQEVGGVMVTLAALCLANDLDMHVGGDGELARIWTKVEQIRAKQAAKPKHSPLPEHTAADAGEPAIKALEWNKTSYGTPEVNTIAGVYRLSRAWSGGWSVNIKNEVLRDSDGRTNFATLELAKAAAQADFEARIRSALVPAASPAKATPTYELAKVALREAGRPTTFERVEKMAAALTSALRTSCPSRPRAGGSVRRSVGGVDGD